MRTTGILATTAMTVLMLGCDVTSLHPLYTEDDPVFDPALLGTWADDQGGQWVLSKSGDKGYELVMKPKQGEPALYSAHLVRLGALRFLDTYPKDFKSSHASHAIATHGIWRIELDGNVVRRAYLRKEWFEKMRPKKKSAIPHEVVGKGAIVLTAPPRRLQALMLEYADDKQAFSSPREFRKQK